MYTVRFSNSNCDSDSVEEIGGKNASLGELMNAEIPVPAGFAVSTAFYSDFLEQTNVGSVIENTLSDGSLVDSDAIQSASDRIIASFEAAEFPPALESELREAWDELATDIGTDPTVAVRSSATAEDLPDASFAGQQDTFLSVSGYETVKERIKDCMASLFTARAISYRSDKGFDHSEVRISVGVQQLVEAESAGVMFTLNPSNGDRSKALIEGNWGLGESVVSGEVTPDNFLVDKPTFEIISKEIATKEMMVRRTPDGAEQADVPEDRREEQVISDSQIEDLVTLGKRIERHYGQPQDIEWAVSAEGEIFILQSRPETVWNQEEEPAEKSKDTESSSVADDILSSLGASSV